MKNILIIAFILLFRFTAGAQGNFTIGGIVKNQQGERLQSATVFIAGSQKATSTDDNGEFLFRGIGSGTYQVVVNMLGYNSLKQDVLVKDGSASLSLTMTEKSIVLDQVVIGPQSKRGQYLKTFLEYFMGESDNAKASKILNPEIIDFSTSKTLLKATTDNFLEIENVNLGYKVKYLLRTFQYDEATATTYYDGESVFEPMTGTPEQQKVWDANRAKAYEGSLMHYLRSAYDNTTREQGFLTYTVVSPEYPITIVPNAVDPAQLIKRVDSNFVTFNYKKRIYIEYNKKKADKEDKPSTKPNITIDLAPTGSVFMTDAEIDKRGSYTNSQSILIQGYWGAKRIGDQLPIEYVYIPQKK